MKLISMTDFVLSDKVKSTLEYGDAYKMIRNYAQFLKKPLTLGMFVPTDEDGNVLEEPKIRFDGGYDIDEMESYQQAKERVLFEGFNVEFNAVMSPSGGYLDVGNLRHKTIETIVGANLTLTLSALKQIGT